MEKDKLYEIIWSTKTELQKAEIELSEMDDKYEELKDEYETLQVANRMLLDVIEALQKQYPNEGEIE